MDLTLSFSGSEEERTHTIELPHSKSILNRLLILGIHHSLPIDPKYLDSEDLSTLQKAIDQMRNADAKGGIIDIKDSGSACRFMIPVLAFRKGDWMLQGADRMHERPVEELVDALRSIGCKIDYVQSAGHLPLRISGIDPPVKLSASFRGTQSSQYISALLLCASLFHQGAEITFPASQVSTPYIYMTMSLLERFGYRVVQSELDNDICIDARYEPTSDSDILDLIEPDWSAASFFFLLKGSGFPGKILLRGLKPDSVQGDSHATTISQQLGVESEFTSDGLLINDTTAAQSELELDISAHPDLVIPAVVLSAMRHTHLKISGIEHLRFKESDRIDALNNNLEQIGYVLTGAQGVYTLEKSGEWKESVSVDSFNDHRIAMAFAALALKQPVEIRNADAVSKSFPEYWNKMRGLGFNLQEH